MKKKINLLKRKLIKIWQNDYRDILVPVFSVIVFIFALLAVGFGKAFLILLLINGIYFTLNYISYRNIKKKKGSRKYSSKEKQKKQAKTKAKLLLTIMLYGFIFVVISIIAFFIFIVIQAPEFDEKNLYVSEPSIILDKDGKEVAKLGAEKRVLVTYDEIPEVLIDAIIATEDSRFFEHNGVDWARFLKASVYQLIGKSEAGGASTLTMQVSKNAYTSTEDTGIKGIIRKFTDVYISTFVIEKNYTKEQIMEFYVNSQWLAKNTYGVEQTSLTYFGKSAKDLNVSEAAVIAGLFQAPGRYDPYRNPEATETRRQRVLKLMLRHGYIDKDEYDIAMKMTVDKIVIPQEESIYSSSEVSEYQSFIDTVVDEVKEKTGKNPYNTSMIIYTTLDTNIQDYVNDIMNGETFNWDDDYAKGGVAILNVKDGSITAIGGGRNVNIIDSYNYATEIENQIGSTAKPLYDYGPAIEYNNWSSYQILVDEPISYSDGTPIHNWNGTYEGFETARTALAGSRNIPALKTFKQNNKANVIDFVTKLGLTPEIYSCKSGYTRSKDKCINKEDPSDVIAATKASTMHEAHAIGGYNGESPLSMAAAYSAFANKGVYTKPYSFTKLVYQDTGEEFVNDIKKTKVMSEETAYIISDMLVTTGQQALGRYANINGVKYSAKTGTTNYDAKTLRDHNMPGDAVNDYWVIGYNTEYAIGVWYGFDKIDNKHYNSVNKAPHARLFQAIGKKVFTSKNTYTKPNGVVAVEVESGCPTAMLPSEYTPSNLRQTELFIKGTEPTTVSQRFAKLSDVSNLNASTTDNKVTLTWNAVKTPDIMTESYLREYFKPVFENAGYLNSHVSKVMQYNNSQIGSIEYNIYVKDDNGNLKLLDHTASTKFETEMEVAGEYTFVVKTTYSIFKNNMSDGKSVTVNVTTKTPIIPEPDDSDENSDINDDQNNP